MLRSSLGNRPVSCHMPVGPERVFAAVHELRDSCSANDLAIPPCLYAPTPAQGAHRERSRSLGRWPCRQVVQTDYKDFLFCLKKVKSSLCDAVAIVSASADVGKWHGG